MANEHWEDVAGFEKTHQVSDLAHIRSKKTGRILRTFLDKSKRGDVCIDLYVDNLRFRKRLKQLVASAFISDCLPGYGLRHINGDRTDCTLENLEYYQLDYSKQREETAKTRKSKLAAQMKKTPQKRERTGVESLAPAAKLNMTIARIIRADWKLDPEPSTQKYADKYGVNRKTIWQIVNNQSWKEAASSDEY